jgi:hypothetical protein
MINVADGYVPSNVDFSLPHYNDVFIEQKHESEVHLLRKVCTIQLLCYNDIYDNLSDISVVFRHDNLSDISVVFKDRSTFSEKESVRLLWNFIN